jgi:sugar lactone lactonase YvrE
MKNIRKVLVSSLLLLATSSFASSVGTVETVAKFDNKRPGNFTITKEGRVFVTMQPLDAPSVKLIELGALGAKNVYPDAKYSTGKDSVLKSAIGIKMDKEGNLWLLDLGTKQFVVWDIKKNKLVKTIKIPPSVTTEFSFLQDFVLDEKRGRAIIADMTQGDLKSAPVPAFVVVDMKTGKAKRIAQSHPSMMPDSEGGFALNPIAIDPDFNWVYFGALNGKKVYRVPASSFSSEAKVIKNIKEYGPKSYSDGIAVDKNQNVYITNIEEQAIGVTNKDGYKTIANLPEGQSWPDGLVVSDDGYVYASVNQLNRTAALNKGVEAGTAPYLIVKTKLVK